jgi:hypothetical protein
MKGSMQSYTLCCVFSELRRDMIVHFVDIGGIVDFLDITIQSFSS